MTIFKMISYDIHQGLFRKRLALAAIIPLMQCSILYSAVKPTGISPSWFDYNMYIFQGVMVVDNMVPSNPIPFPTFWIMVVCCCFLLCVDYPVRDLSHFGLQILVRCNKRSTWFYSKCAWNFMSTILYYLIILFVTFIFTVLSKGTTSIMNTALLSSYICGGFGTVSLESFQLLQIAILLPLLTLATFNLLCMIIGLITSPIISTLICISLVILPVYWESPWILGNGAMIMRSAYVTDNGISARSCLLFLIFTYLLCVSIGERSFFYHSIYSPEE